MNKSRCFSKVSAVAAAAAMAASMAVPASAASSASEYYEKIIRKNSAAETKATVELYQAICSAGAAPTAASEDISVSEKVYFEPGAMLGGLLGIKEGTKLGIVSTSTLSGEDAAEDCSLLVNSTELLKISAAVKDNVLYASVPTLSSSWIKATEEEFIGLLESELSETSGEYGLDEQTAAAPAVSPENITFFDGKVITKERAERIENTYTDIYLKYTGNVKIKNNVPVTVGDLSTTYTRATIELSGDEIYSLASDIVNTAAKDSDLKAVWKSFGLSSEEYTELFKEVKSSLRQSKSEFKDMSCTIEQYINKKGEFMGQKVSVSSASNPDDNAESYLMSIEDGERSAVEGSSKSPSYSYSYSASGTEDASGKSDVKGKVNVSVKELDENNKIKTTKQKYAFSFSGTDTDGTFKMTGDLADSGKFTLNVTSKGTATGAKLVYSMGGQKLFTLTATATQGKAQAIGVPTENVYSIAVEEEQGAFAASLDPTALIANIESVRSDLGDALTDSLVEIITELFTPAEETAAAQA